MGRKHIVLFISAFLVQYSSCQLAALFGNEPAPNPAVDPAPQLVITETEKPKASQGPDSTIPASSLDQPVHDPPSALGVLGNEMTFPDPPPLDPMPPPPASPQDLNNFGPDQGQPELSQLATELGLDFNFFTDPITPSDSSNQAGVSSLFTSNADPTIPSIPSVDTPVNTAPEKPKSLSEMAGSSSVTASSSGVVPMDKPKSLADMIGSSSAIGTLPSTETGISPIGIAVDPIQEKPKSLSDLMGPSESIETTLPTGIDLPQVGGSVDSLQENSKSLSEMLGSSSTPPADGLSFSVFGGPIDTSPLETSEGLSGLFNSGDAIQASLPQTDPALETAARREQQLQINDNSGSSPVPSTNLGMPRSVSDPSFRLPSSGLISPQVNLPGSSPFGQLPETPVAGQHGRNQLSGGLPQGQPAGGPFPFSFPGGMMGDPRLGFPNAIADPQTDQRASPSVNGPASGLQNLQPGTEVGQQNPQGTRNAQTIPGRQPSFDPRITGMFPPFMPPGMVGFPQAATGGQAPDGSSLPPSNAQTAQTDSTQGPGNQQMFPQAPMIPPFMNPAFLPQNVPGSRQPSNPTQLSTQGTVTGSSQTNRNPTQVQRNQPILPQAAMFPGLMPSPFLPPRFPGHPQTSLSQSRGASDSQMHRSDPSLPQRPSVLLPPGFPRPPISGEPVNPVQSQLPTENISENRQTSQADPSLLPRAEQVLREVESLVNDLRSSSSRPGLNIQPTGEGYCPNGNPRAVCDVNPCDEVSCINFLNARCRPACDSCTATFYGPEWNTPRRRNEEVPEKDVTRLCIIVRWGRPRPGQEQATSAAPAEPRRPFIDAPSERRRDIPSPPRPRRGPDGRPLLLNPEDTIMGQAPRPNPFPRGFPGFQPGRLDPRIPARFRGLPRLPPSLLDPRLRRGDVRGATVGAEQGGPRPFVLPDIARLIRAGRLDRRDPNALRSRPPLTGITPTGLNARAALSGLPGRPSNARNEVEQALSRFERQSSRRSM